MGGSIYFSMSPKFQGNTSPIVFHFVTTGTSFTNPNHKGLYTQTSKKGGANGMNLWKDGALLATNSTAVMNPFSTGRTILALNNIPAGQGIGNFYPFNLALDAAFDAFDATDEAVFRGLWDNYKSRAGLP